MSIKYKEIAELTCDDCKTTLQEDSKNKVHALAYVKEWKRIVDDETKTSKDYCPNCCKVIK